MTPLASWLLLIAVGLVVVKVSNKFADYVDAIDKQKKV